MFVNRLALGIGLFVVAVLGGVAVFGDMMQRFGAVFAIAVASAVFTAYEHFDTPPSVTRASARAGRLRRVRAAGRARSLAIAPQPIRPSTPRPCLFHGHRVPVSIVR